jgi:hypothetical protein
LSSGRVGVREVGDKREAEFALEGSEGFEKRRGGDGKEDG